MLSVPHLHSLPTSNVTLLNLPNTYKSFLGVFSDKRCLLWEQRNRCSHNNFQDLKEYIVPYSKDEIEYLDLIQRMKISQDDFIC